MAGNRKLIVEFVGDTRDLDRAFGKASRSAKQFSVGIGTIVKSAVVFGAVTKGFDLLGDAVGASINEFSQQQKVAAQTAAVIKSQGDVAGVTAKQVDQLAESISQMSGIDDEVVQSGENILLTFRNIRNVAGAPIFDQATQSATDLSVAMGIDLPKAALQIGKALNDPIRGLARLQRIGVQFSADQVKLIKHFEETGQTAKAQGVILRELQREFGGSAKALGETVPGSLNRIRETFRNIGGSIVGVLAPGLQKGLDSVADFVSKIGQAKGAKAKISVAFEGIQNLGRDLFDQIRSAIEAIDWPAAVKTVEDGLAEGIRRIGDFLGQINWGAVGRAIGDGIVAGLKAATAFLQSVDWGVVGRQIVHGIATFLKNVNWKALAIGVVKLLVVAFKGTLELLGGIGIALAQGLFGAIRDGFRAIGPKVEELALRLVLKIIKPLDFTIFGKHIIPGLNSLVKKIEGKLDELAANAEANAARVAAAAGKAAGSINRSAAIIDAGPTPKPKPTPRKPATQADLTPAPTVVKPTGPTPKERQRQRFDDLVDALGLKFERANLKGAFAVALKRNTELQNAIKAQIKIEGKTTELMRQLFDAQDQRTQLIKDRAAAQSERDQARQFARLGLGATGEQIVPSTEALAKRFAKIDPTTLSAAARQKLQVIGRLLHGQFGKLGNDIRSWIDEFFDGINKSFKDGSENVIKINPRTQAINKDAILAGLGLDRDTERTIRARLSGINRAGRMLSPTPGTVGAFGITITPQPIHVHSNLYVDGQKMAQNTTIHQQKNKRSNPAQKRGPLRGI